MPRLSPCLTAIVGPCEDTADLVTFAHIRHGVVLAIARCQHKASIGQLCDAGFFLTVGRR